MGRNTKYSTAHSQNKGARKENFPAKKIGSPQTGVAYPQAPVPLPQATAICYTPDVSKIDDKEIDRSAELSDAVQRLWDDPLAFGEAIGYNGDATGRKVFGPFHRAMLEHTLSAPRTSTVVPRGHAKSTVISVIKNAHALFRDPSERILLGCAGLDLAKKLVGEIRDRLDGELELLPGIFISFREAFPWVAPVRTPGGKRSGPTEAFNIEGRAGRGREPSVFASSVSSNLAGNHPTRATIDDPANEQNSRTFARRQQTIEFIQQLEPLMHSPSSPIDHIGTPWAFHDVTHYLGEHAGWTQFRFGLYDGKDGGVLCPSFLTAEEADRIASSVSRQFFAAQYLCAPIPAEEALFDDDMIRASTSGDLTLSALPAGPEVLLWDPVGRVTGNEGDKNGILIVRVIPAAVLGFAGFERDRNIFLPVRAHEVSGGADAAAAWIENIAIKEHPLLQTVWVEKAAAQSIIVPWMEERRKLGGVKVRPHKIPHTSLPFRLQGVQTAFRKGTLQLLPEFPGRALLIKRLTEFPLGDTDDLLAALALLSTAIDRKGNVPGTKDLQSGVDYARVPWRTGPSAGGTWPS